MAVSRVGVVATHTTGLQEGCGLDCSSAAELHEAALLGVPGERVMFTSNYTSATDLTIAVKQGVILNLDDITLVSRVTEVRAHPDSGGGVLNHSCRVSLRVGRAVSLAAPIPCRPPSTPLGLRAPPARGLQAAATTQYR